MENNTANQVIAEKQENNKVSTSVVIGVAAALLLGATTYFFVRNNKMIDSNVNTEKVYTLAEVAKNNSNSNCWTVIDGNVYNITKFISKHEGGDRILAVCGIDGTDLFTGKSPLGRVHSNMAKTLLSKMQIGKLQK